MTLSRARKKRPILSITSLIDVIFLLLLFFMLTTSFSRYGEIDLISATRSSDPTKPDLDPVFISLGATAIDVNRKPVLAAELKAAVAALVTGATPVLIEPQAGLTTAELVKTMQSLGTIDGAAVGILSGQMPLNREGSQ